MAELLRVLSGKNEKNNKSFPIKCKCAEITGTSQSFKATSLGRLSGVMNLLNGVEAEADPCLAVLAALGKLNKPYPLRACTDPCPSLPYQTSRTALYLRPFGSNRSTGFTDEPSRASRSSAILGRMWCEQSSYRVTVHIRPERLPACLKRQRKDGYVRLWSTIGNVM